MTDEYCQCKQNWKLKQKHREGGGFFWVCTKCDKRPKPKSAPDWVGRNFIESLR